MATASMEVQAGAGTPATAAPGSFLRVGDSWRVEYAGSTVYVRDARGMRYLAYLLARPHAAVHACALANDGAASRTAAAETDAVAVQRARSAVSKRIHDAVRHLTELHLPLGRHLSACIHTGVHCRYSPDPREPQEWTV